VARKLGDLPTMKLDPSRLASYAKRADADVAAREGRVGNAPDIDVRIEFLDEVPTAVRRSDVLPIARTVEGPSLEAVPVIAVARDDLAWFAFEAETNALLARIDGHTTVGELLASVAVPPDRALTLLRDLELQRVIALA
jgi:hypothetical protein